MLPLKVFLYTICFLSLAWGAVIFSGPSIISRVVSSYSNGQMVASNIVVTPKLDVKIGRLDFALKGKDGLVGLEGFSRSVRIVWSILSTEPLLKAQVGPTFINDFMIADGFTIYTPNLSQINFNEIVLNSKFSNLEVVSVGGTDDITIKAVYSVDQSFLNDVFIDTDLLWFDKLDPWKMTGVGARVDMIDLNVPIDEQKILFEGSIKYVENEKRSIRLVGLEGLLRLLDDRLDFNFEMQESFHARLGKLAQRLNMQGSYSEDKYLKDARIEIFYGPDDLEERELSKTFVEIINLEPGKYHTQMIGNMEPVELNFRKNYVGSLPASSFEVDLSVDTYNLETHMKSKVLLEDSPPLEISGIADLNLKLTNSVNIFDCYILECDIAAVNLDYKVGAVQEWVSGTVSCNLPPCNFSTMRHKLKTSDTAKLFAAINQSKILSPLYVAYLYALVSSGVKLDKGHEIILN